jgi:TRAP-type C4-dicarboxylate transport system permease large subunit
MALVFFIAWKRDSPLTGEAFSLRRIAHELKRSFLIFLMPVVVIGGIIVGAFTATKGCAIAVVFALLIGFSVANFPVENRFASNPVSVPDLPVAPFQRQATGYTPGCAAGRS